VDISEYSDDMTIIIKFCKGLDPNIQNMVATLGEHAPKINEPEKWFEVVQKVSRNQDVNKAFLENNQRKTCPPPHPTFVTVRQPLIPVCPANPPESGLQSVPTPRPTYVKDGPAPLEVA